ncbi:unnamed protein product [Caenorhabditis sp. 36 PRJEB53466]|nr:unnamed protein product [Caenorhabditis sp. 36 PRJEB53466]
MSAQTIASIGKSAQQIRDETVLFIENWAVMDEHQISMPASKFLEDHPPRLPIFFVKSYNSLKELCKTIPTCDPVLDMVPHAVQMAIWSEAPKRIEMPEVLSDGLLKEDETETLEEQVRRLQADTEQYVEFSYVCRGELPSLHAYIRTCAVFKKRAVRENVDSDLRELIFNLGRLVNARLTRLMGPDVIPRDYFETHGAVYFDY